ncbi:MAG: DUF5107 domain-containing protein [Cyclobacteriaceae bacterium]|nr:DUF5107 domain-containing protein [Cyclobacteriaceae bacterium]
MTKTCFLIFILFINGVIACHFDESVNDRVKIYEESITIPTYLTGDPETNPVFYTPRNYQGAQLRVYPYPYINKLTEERVDKVYKGLFIENKYVRICVLPELGGRLYSAVDKTNGYDFVYRNRVIKPALIGMAGAWISGGVEWNIPHHHRVSTFMPVDYRLTENPDGSKTIWVGEFEKRNQSRWITGMTLYPGKSYIKTDIRLFNTTPYAQSFLAWANTAVHANEDYQVVFPPDVERAVFHSKVEFVDFPVADQFYRGIDFRNNVDVTWWKNTTSPTSFFAWDTEMDFLGGIDHGKKAGTVLVGDHKVFIGKKFWNWGNNDVARLWDEMLTEADGPYLELMMGMYSDNQPDYSWNDPHAAKMGTMYYMPLRKMTSIKNANTKMAVNLDVDGDSLLIELSAFSVFRKAKIEILKGGELFYQETVAVAPDNPVERKIEAENNARYLDYAIRVLSDEGKTLIAYHPPAPKNDPVPPVYNNPESPALMNGADQLYLAGLRLEQFGNPDYNPFLYYQEALRLDPDHLLANTRLGIHYLKNNQYLKAEEHLGKAAEMVTGNYTTPLHDEPLYNLGILHFMNGEYGQAQQLLERVVWREAWKSPAAYYLALISARQGRGEEAITIIRNTLGSENRNVESLGLLVSLLRKSGDFQEAGKTLQILMELDPLNLWGIHEGYLLQESGNLKQDVHISREVFTEIFRDEPDNYLEIAARYSQCGLHEEARDLLEIAREKVPDSHQNFPLIQYYQAYILKELGDPEKSARLYSEAATSPGKNCFPYGQFTEKVLLSALEETPGDPSAHYYLGNLYGDSQPQKAVHHWLRSIAAAPGNAAAYRNIAFIKANILNETDTAVICIKKAIEFDPEDPLYLIEADQYYAYLGFDPSVRLQQLNDHLETAKKADRADLRRIKLNNYTGNYEEAINSLKQRNFHIEEITDINPHTEWTDAHLQKGLDLMQKEEFKAAIEALMQIFEFPRNLEIARDSRTGIANYWIARCYEKMGNSGEADKCDNKMTAFETQEGWGGEKLPLIDFYAGLSFEKTGNTGEANRIYRRLLERSDEMLKAKPHGALDLRSIKVRQELKNQPAEAYLVRGLAYWGLKELNKARESFRKALEIQPDLLDAKLFADHKLPLQGKNVRKSSIKLVSHE